MEGVLLNADARRSLSAMAGQIYWAAVEQQESCCPPAGLGSCVWLQQLCLLALTRLLFHGLAYVDLVT